MVLDLEMSGLSDALFHRGVIDCGDVGAEIPLQDVEVQVHVCIVRVQKKVSFKPNTPLYQSYNCYLHSYHSAMLKPNASLIA